MTFFKQLFREGKLPTVETEVDVAKDTINYIAVTVLIVAVIIIMFAKLSKKI